MEILSTYSWLENPDTVFVAFDIETTGLSPTLDRIIELGAVKFQNGEVVDTFQELISPGIPLPPQSVEIHGITEDMLVGKPDIRVVLPRFLEFAQGTILLAHNAEFDVNFILRSMASHGLGSDLPHKIVDTLPMSKQAFPERKSYKLQNLARDLEIETGSAHRAKDDARVCQELFLQCLKRLNPGGQASFF